MLEKTLDLLSPVPSYCLYKAIALTLTLSCSLEITKATGPADVCGPWSFVSRPRRTILAKNLADKFCKNVQTDTLAASKHMML